MTIWIRSISGASSRKPCGAVAEWRICSVCAGWIKEQGRELPGANPDHSSLFPYGVGLQCQQTTLQALLSMLDGVLINYISVCLASARTKNSKRCTGDRLNVHDTTRLWLYSGLPSRAGALSCPPAQLRPELFEDRRWSGAAKSLTSQQQLLAGVAREHGSPFTHWVQMRRNGILMVH